MKTKTRIVTDRDVDDFIERRRDDRLEQELANRDVIALVADWRAGREASLVAAAKPQVSMADVVTMLDSAIGLAGNGRAAAFVREWLTGRGMTITD